LIGGSGISQPRTPNQLGQAWLPVRRHD
jgi:hypothetical protein